MPSSRARIRHPLHRQRTTLLVVASRFPLLRGCPKGGGFRRVYLCLRFAFSFLLLDEKESKNQGRLHRSSSRLSKRLTIKLGSDFCKVKRKRPSLKVKRLAILCGRFPAWRPSLPAHPSRYLAFQPTVSIVFTFVLNDILPPQTLMADKDPPSLAPPEDYILVVASRHCERSATERGNPDEPHTIYTISISNVIQLEGNHTLLW